MIKLDIIDELQLLLNHIYADGSSTDTPIKKECAAKIAALLRANNIRGEIVQPDGPGTKKSLILNGTIILTDTREHHG